MTKAELDMLLFQNKIRINGARRCFPETYCIAVLQMQAKAILEALYNQ